MVPRVLLSVRVPHHKKKRKTNAVEKAFRVFKFSKYILLLSCRQYLNISHWSRYLVWGCYSCSMSWARIAWPSPSHTRSTTGLNSEFSFSYTDHTKVKKAQSALLFTQSWNENCWIHAFLKSISAMWNANCKDLNSGCRVSFLRR